MKNRWAIAYGIWAILAIGLALLAGGLTLENRTRLLVLLLLAFEMLGREQLAMAFLRWRPRTRYLVWGLILAALVEGLHMISTPVFLSLRITAETPWPRAFLNYALDLAYTLPAYVVIFSVMWALCRHCRFSLWTYTFWMGLGQALGDGGLVFFLQSPGLVVFLPYVMTNYHAVNVLPYVSAQPRGGSKPGWLAVPVLITTYFICGATIRIVGARFGFQ